MSKRSGLGERQDGQGAVETASPEKEGPSLLGASVKEARRKGQRRGSRCKCSGSRLSATEMLGVCGC